MRAADPVYRERRFGWVLTRYDDIAWALRALDLLVAGGPDQPERHQTLRGAIGWSYGLLCDFQNYPVLRRSR